MEKKVNVHISRETGGAYADAQDVIESEIERIQRDRVVYGRETRTRLEREVIEAAKAFVNEDADRWDRLTAYRKLYRAVETLEQFESSN